MSSLTALALSGTAVALYFYSNGSRSAGSNRGDDGDDDGTLYYRETHETAYRAPKSFFEDLYFFVEGLRYMYGETLYKWKTADLVFGLYYLCSKNSAVYSSGGNDGWDEAKHPLHDIGMHGNVFGLDQKDDASMQRAKDFLRLVEKCLRYNSCLRERRPIYRKRRVIEIMGVKEEHFLKQAVSAGVLKPSYVLIRDEELKRIVLMIRGTHSIKDAFTSLTGASKPHHVVDSNGVTLGYSHFGMLAAARWLKAEIGDDLVHALDESGYDPLIIGHSLGGGTAAMLTMMLREQGGVFENATCISIACPACMTLELAESCKEYVTTIVNGCDVIPTMSSGAADGLREEVTNSSWYSDFHRDMRSYRVFRAFESVTSTTLRGFGSATSWIQSNSAACQSRQLHKRKNSSRNDGDTNEGWLSYTSTTKKIQKFISGYWNGSKSKEDETFEDIRELSIDNGPDSLRAEASFRMRAVRDAVLDAEAEELKEEQQEDDLRHSFPEHANAVPSVIRPGTYGNVSPQKSSQAGWKRSMYPAGRIMHFVPATVVPGYEDSNIEEDDGMSPMDEERIIHQRAASELGMEDILGAEESLHYRSLSNDPRIMNEPLPALKKAPGPAPKNMLLLDHVPQRLYGRIRPSTTILSDHVIPNYIRSLQSFKKRFPI